ncbi:MAG: ribosome maturation factor RimP [Firmicutes bacterium]|nr:ribosome maturation factor RimP [Bacillota bacterium]
MNLEKIKETVFPIVEGFKLELVDIEYLKQHGQNHLTIFIAGDNPITLEDCEKVHNAIDVPLEELNPSNDSPYVLNVSSPGLDRPFKTQRDFERNYNKMVEVKLYAPYRGQKIYEGVLIEKLPNVVAINAKVKGKEERMQFENSKVVFVRPFVSFEGLEC